MRRSAAPLVRALAIAVLTALPIAQIGACSGETGVTPNCTPNIDENGIQTDVENGCTGFAICAANPANPKVCCTSADGKSSKERARSLPLLLRRRPRAHHRRHVDGHGHEHGDEHRHRDWQRRRRRR